MVRWQQNSSYWVVPDGRTRVICRCPSRGYALERLISPREALAHFLPNQLEELEAKAYPYDFIFLRWNVRSNEGASSSKNARR